MHIAGNVVANFKIAVATFAIVAWTSAFRLGLPWNLRVGRREEIPLRVDLQSLDRISMICNAVAVPKVPPKVCFPDSRIWETSSLLEALF
jgi:hypothetical protein